MQAAPPQFPAKSRMPGGDRRKQLLRVAIEVFARNGFSGTKTRDIAAAAGISEAILFRHFATKEDLYHAILDEKENEGCINDMSLMEDAMRRRDDAELLRLIGRHILRAFREDPAFQRLVLYASLEGHIIASLFQQRFAPRSEFFKNYVRQRQQEGAFRPCDPDIAHLMSVGAFVHFAMCRYVIGFPGPAGSEEQLIEEMVAITLAGLANPEKIHLPKVNACEPENHLKINASRKVRKETHAKS